MKVVHRVDDHSDDSPQQCVEPGSSDTTSVPPPSNPTNRCLVEPLGGGRFAEDALPDVARDVLPLLLVNPEVELVLRFHPRV